MNFADQKMVKKLRKEFPVGCRIVLDEMDDRQAPPIGTQGTCNGVDDAGNILVNWDTGSHLNVAYGADSCHRVATDAEVKVSLSHARIANLMSNETWMNAKKAVELGFADEILFAKKEEEPDSDPADPENPEEDPDSEPGEGEEKKPFQKDTAGHLFSSRQMDLIVLNRLGVKPEDVGQKHTEPKEPPADPKPSAEPTPPAEPPANSGPVLDLDGKTEDGSIPYNILMKQLECMK